MPVNQPVPIGQGVTLTAAPTGVVARTLPRTSGISGTAGLTSGTPRLQLLQDPLPANVPITALTFFSVGAFAAVTNGWFFLADLDRKVLAITYDDAGAGTGDTTNGSPTVGNLSSVATWHQGQGISGAGIPVGATVLSVSTTSLTMSANATATAAGVALAPAWAANAKKTLLLQATFTPVYDRAAYIGVMSASTVGTLAGLTGNATVNAEVPVHGGNSSTTLQTVPVAVGTQFGALTASATEFYAYVS